MNFLSHKYFHISVRFLLIFLISLMLFYLLPGEIPGRVDVVINVEETMEAGLLFSFRIGTIVEVILMGPVFVILYYILIKDMFSKIDIGKARMKKIIYTLELLAVLLICMVIVGHVVHLMFDYGNALFRQVSGYDTSSELFLFLYHSDEWVGHHLIHVGFFGFIVLALIGESLIADKRMVKWYELIFIVPLGVGIFVMSGYATYEGQCGWLLMVLSAILLGVEIGVLLIKWVNPLKYPILIASIIGNIIIIGYYIWYTTTFGTIPFYPFAPQP